MLLTHPAMNSLGDVCGRTGHTTNTSLDYYNDTRNVTRGTRGGKALAQWDDVRGGVSVPRFECLGPGTSDAVNALVNKLFVSSLVAFKPGGTLYGVLRICGASLVMHHAVVTKSLGQGNVISTKLRTSAELAKISDPAFPMETTDGLLIRWSEIIFADYKIRNPEIQEATPDLRSLTRSVNQQSNHMNRIEAQVEQLVANSARRDVVYELQQTQMNWYIQQLMESQRQEAQLRQENAQLRGQISHARENHMTMQSALQSPRRYGHAPEYQQQFCNSNANQHTNNCRQ